MSHNIYALQVSKAYSKTWSFREDALLEVYKQMNELTSSDEARNMLRASVFLIARAIKDQVFAVSHLTSYCTRHLFCVKAPLTNLQYCCTTKIKCQKMCAFAE